MVIFNGREISSKFLRNNKIIEISSPIKDISEAIETMRECVKNGEPLEKFYITAYQYSEKPFAIINKDLPEWKGKANVFDEVLDEVELESLIDMSAIYKRPKEFVDFEKFQFNLSTDMEFKTIQVSNEEILIDFMVSYGILPTLLNLEEEKSISELKELSKQGENLVRMFDGEKYSISRFNAPPPLSWIEDYQKLNPYEKKLVTDSRIHPAKVMQIKRGLSEYAKDSLIRKEIIESVVESYNQGNKLKSKEIVEAWTLGYGNQYKEMLTLAEEVFKAKFRGHAPRVLAEYMEGALASRGIDPAKATREEIEEIASNFSQQSVSRIAKYRNPVLLALSEKIPMGNMKDNLVQAIGVSIGTKELKTLFDKGLPEWLNENPNVKVEEFLKICSILKDLDGKLDPKDKPKDVIAKIELKDGYIDAKRFEDKTVYKNFGYKFENNEIAIKGRNISAKQGNLTIRMLAADDYKNFLVGKYTHCCQRYGDAGESCVYKYTSDPFAACVVIERGDQILAQGFVWTDEINDVFVFDNVELANDRDVQQFSDLFSAYAEALPYKNVHVGTGYNQGMNGWGVKVGQDTKNKIFAVMPTTIDGRRDITSWGNGNCYSDYHIDGGSIARAIKHNGVMKLNKKADVIVSIKPDEPTKWDDLTKPEFSFMLNDWNKTIEERLELAKLFQENPSPEIQMDIVKSSPLAVISLDEVCEEAQRYILDNHRHLIWKIKNPIDDVKIAMVKEDPTYLKYIENPPEELVLDAVRKDGTIISIIENPSEEICLEAVKQNGYAIKSIPLELQTERVQMAAIEREPKIATILKNPSEEVLISAVSLRPELISIVGDRIISSNVQMAAVNVKPSVINMIPYPNPDIVSYAIHKNGLLIRNFQKEYPELREVALRQNGYAIRCLHNVSLEEARIAIEQNPKVIDIIKNKEIVNILKEEYDFLREDEPNESIPFISAIERGMENDSFGIEDSF